MSKPPGRPKLYHITHISNLTRIVNCGELQSDYKLSETTQTYKNVAMSKIKRRRLSEIRIPCCASKQVGEFVPFYFCPRSIMLFILHKSNHPELSYSEGQKPLIHLVADMHAAVDWARDNARHWAFSDRNAGAYIARFYNSAADLDRINWDAVRATDFREQTIKEGKQAEFLMHDSVLNKLGRVGAAFAALFFGLLQILLVVCQQEHRVRYGEKKPQKAQQLTPYSK